MQRPSKPHESKQPVHINTPFKCGHCGKENEKASKTCRNHCRFCLYSKHVDLLTPGDRKSVCGGLMEPIYIDYKAKKGYQIIHRCLKCGQLRTNKAADDDSPGAIEEVIKRQNYEITGSNSGRKHRRK